MRAAMPPVTLLNPFDAYAGSQRVATQLFAAFEALGARVRVQLGFGGHGFVSDLPDVRADLVCGSVRVRKLLFPLWSLALAPLLLLRVLRGERIWGNTIYALPPAMLAALVRPRQVFLHLHELTFPGVFRPLLRLAMRRGVRVMCVSHVHASGLGIDATILANPVAVPDLPPASARDRFLYIGTTAPMKGFALYLDVAARLGGTGLRPVAYLADLERHDAGLLAKARALGVAVHFGETAPSTLFADGFLTLLATDPELWVETFSLVAVESCAFLVPVGGAGAEVLDEVLGPALAFNIASRDPAEIAARITALAGDPARQAELRAACEVRRGLYTMDRFREALRVILQGEERE